MGDYPYPSSYMSSGDGLLPAYPMISACSYLSSTFGSDPQSEFELLSAVEKAVSIFYNASLSLSCYSLPSNLSAPNTNALLNPWNYQWSFSSPFLLLFFPFIISFFLFKIYLFQTILLTLIII